MQTAFFRINTKEYCHITNDTIFIFNSKTPTRIPLEHELGNAWSVKSILNYIVFAFLLFYISLSLSRYGAHFFYEPINYGGLLLLFLSFIRIKEGLMSSNTPSISRNKIKSVYVKTPRFSYPRFVVYFEGPEGKVLRRTFSILYQKEALPILKANHLIAN
jgi:hypothetical protein